MRYNRLIALCVAIVLAFMSCKKDHYDTDNLQGINMDGEVMVPVGSTSFTLMKLMEQFKIDSIINCTEDGNLSFGFHYEDFGVLQGESFLHFDNLNYDEHFTFENPFPFALPQVFDTVLRFEQTILFESDCIQVMEALMKSGRFEFMVSSNVPLLQRMVVSSSDIKDEEGNEMMLDFDFTSNSIGIDLAGMHYTTDSVNTLDLKYDLYLRFQGVVAPELFFDVNVQGTDLAIQEMSGYVDTFVSRNYIDTIMTLFPSNVTGAMEVHGARLKLMERNTFDLDALLNVDTAWVIGDDGIVFPVFEQTPLEVPLQTNYEFGEVLNTTLNGRITANQIGIFTASDFIVSPNGLSDRVSVVDTCQVDVIVDAEIPFNFAVDDVRVIDTSELNVADTEMPNQIEKLTLELTCKSTIPLDLNVQLYTYDSINACITDTLVAPNDLIRASLDGKPVTTEVVVEVTGDKIDHFLQADHLIQIYHIDTEAHNVQLKAEQGLDVFMKAKLKYNGVIELEKE